MARFYPVYCRRSDGTNETIAKERRKEPNQPTSDQLDQKPDKNGISDYYREVAPEEAKHLDWRRKLGGMLAREMDWKDKNASLGNENGYMLIAFPENYRLYEHVKKTERDGKTEVETKTHAAGGNERQDAYLYGHPEGRRKRYRSPADFFPHVLWLCTDETGDHDNCGCKICSPDDLDDIIPGSKLKPKQDVESKPQASIGMARQGSGPGAAKPKQEPATSAQIARKPNLPQPLVPSWLPTAKSTDQHLDQQYNTFMYRPGELVWFSRGAAWGLGSILRRWLTPSNNYHYTVQPLSHPLSHPPSVTKSTNMELRPWLAWSVPRYTHDGLNNMPNPPNYDSADWQGMKHGRYGHGDLEVDGSILAAKDVDSSYTPLSPNQTTQVEAGVFETNYDSIFLGAEKLWLGDPLRLATGSGTDVLVLHSIVERKQSSSTNQQAAQQSVYFTGDVYKLQAISHANPNVPTPASPASNPQLPQRLTEDIIYRNNRTIPAKQFASFWRLESTQTRFAINDIKGRWYEASLLLPVLQGAAFEDSARKGEIKEASLWMNARGDCVNANRPQSSPRIARQNIRKTTRRDAFGASLPGGAEIRDGVEPPLPDNVDPALDTLASQDSMQIDPKFDTADDNENEDTQVARPGEQELEGGSLDEFMNLDDMEPASQMPGFGKSYGSQGDNQHGFF